MIFEFKEDNERDTRLPPVLTHTITLPMLVKGIDILIDLAIKGEYKNYNFPSGLSSGDIDATDCDALVQCAIFGDVIYG